MNAATTHPLVARWLRDVEQGLAPLTRSRRGDLLSGLREHLDDAVAGAASDADVREALDRLGDPAVVAAAALDEAGVVVRSRRPWVEWLALFFVSIGSLVVPIAGWMLGVVLVWASGIWRTWQKVLASLLFPLGWAGTFFISDLMSAGPKPCEVVGRTTTCTYTRWEDPLWLTFLALSVLGPVVTTWVLAVALHRHRRATAL